MKAILINEKERSFIDMILETIKTGETRTRDMFKSLFSGECPETIALVSTGRGKPIVKGYAAICPGIKLNYKEIKKLDGRLLLSGTSYECQPGKTKVVYWLYNVKACDPYEMPKNAVRHGRSWAEW